MTNEHTLHERPRKRMRFAVALYGGATVLLFYVAVSPLLSEGGGGAKARTREPEQVEVELARHPVASRRAAMTTPRPAEPEAPPVPPEEVPQVPTTPEQQAAKLDRKFDTDGPPSELT